MAASSRPAMMELRCVCDVRPTNDPHVIRSIDIDAGEMIDHMGG